METFLDLRGVKLGQGLPKVIVPAAAPTLLGVLEAARTAVESGADIVEWRADFFLGVNDPGALNAALFALREALKKTPLLFTLRSLEQGGRFECGLEKGTQILLAAAKSGCADLIDVEYSSSPTQTQMLIAKIRALGCETLCSRHVPDFLPPREELYALLCDMKATGARAVKLAAGNLKELFAACARFQKEFPETVLIAMAPGENGVLSRLIGSAFGSAAAFASAQMKTDPGQLSAPSTKTTIGLFHRTYFEAQAAGLSALLSDTALFAFLGAPLTQALSPRMLNKLFIKKGLPYFYFPIETRKEELDTVIKGLRAASIKGFAVTKPYKTDIVKYLDELDASVSRSGTCNTAADRNGKWHGFNTDGVAGVEALCREGGVTVEGETFLCIGAGGTARAMCFELAQQKAKRVYISSRSRSSFVLAEEFNKSFPGVFFALPASDENYLATAPHCGVILNLSGRGMWPNVNDTPFPEDAFLPSHVCFDAVYDPSPTRFLSTAQKRGCRIVNGLTMLKRTVEMQLAIWTEN